MHHQLKFAKAEIGEAGNASIGRLRPDVGIGITAEVFRLRFHSTVPARHSNSTAVYGATTPSQSVSDNVSEDLPI
jgi:hypothetical protein